MNNDINNAAVLANLVQLTVSITRDTAGNDIAAKIGGKSGKSGRHFSELIADAAVSRINLHLTKKLGA